MRCRKSYRCAVLLLATSLGACFAPPVILPALSVNAERALTYYPPGTRAVELEGGEDRILRGVFVPAGDGAPVVLHLVGAAQSPASLGQPMDLATWDFVDLGFASLIVDYGGVGASGGEPDVDALGSDARLMWEEAVRLAGGRPERVLVRATSLGAIAGALVLGSGARPAAVLLVAPVFPDTIVERFAHDQHGMLAGWYASVVYRPVAKVDVIDELARSGASLCVSVFERDTWATDRQRGALHELTTSRTPHQWTVLGGEHIGGVIFAASLLEVERDFVAALQEPTPAPRHSLAELLAELDPQARSALEASPPAAARLELLAARFRAIPADHLAAAALEHDDVIPAGELIRLLRFVTPEDLSFEHLRALYSTAGLPRNELIVTAFTFTFYGGDMLRRGTFRDRSGWDRPRGILRNVQDMTRAAPDIERRLSAHAGTATIQGNWSAVALAEVTRSDEEFRQALARAALKAAGIPDRLVSDDAGGLRLEYLHEGTWLPLPLSVPERATPHREPGASCP